jgi:hypothetical protein
MQPPSTVTSIAPEGTSVSQIRIAFDAVHHGILERVFVSM